jgi:hypothetical protein
MLSVADLLLGVLRFEQHQWPLLPSSQKSPRHRDGGQQTHVSHPSSITPRTLLPCLRLVPELPLLSVSPI